MSEDRVHLNVEEARELGERALRGIGYDAEEARIITDHVVDAALCGYEYSGLAKILNIPENRHFEKPRQPLRLLRETPVSALYDGGNNNGMVAMYHAAKATIAKAEAHGIAIVGITNSWMSGRNAYYVEMIAEAGLVAIHSAGSGASVAPHGGTEAILGTNPIAFAFPGEDGPLVLDMGTSAFMATELQLRERLGTPLPEGVAVDSEGHPTRDAGEARRGALLPFGGHKGFGLALVVQAFGLLGGAALNPGDLEGYIFIAFRPDLLVPMADFKRELAAMIKRVKAVRKQPGVKEIRIPGEQSARNRQRLLREGLDIDRLVLDRLNALAGFNGQGVGAGVASRD
ncbi:MAG TPA: Ldh family oxidoreductase [Stellaceae bacterium]|jgi:LDH2 family malate/lactate/ureidoglycolate dehydrogenase|nr:Ldh family oxidoreductase [Stellaceae bacterium]